MTLDNDRMHEIIKHDITLTLATLTTENVYNFFINKAFILKHDWKLMYNGIRNYSEEYYQTAKEYEKSYFYFPCNIFIMKREYFDEMCDFIFTVLEEVVTFYDESNIVREDRYAGYLIENLLSIYVMHNKDRLKIAYTDMMFYV